MKTTKKITLLLVLILLISASVLAFSSCADTSIEVKVKELLKDDLNTSVEIIKLYYNEEKQGCYVEFKTTTYTDKAGIKLDTNEIVYKSDYDYWSTRIGEHKYNQKILDAAWFAGYQFSVAIYENEGRPQDSDWKRIV
ncbi:MAG: hypothetical protein IJZ28_02535 [Clostridia bacterium]|nr:hypothetical protein [Clostridia bacterium]